MNNFTGLFQSLPSLFDVWIYITAVDQRSQNLLGNDVGWDEVNWKPDIFSIVDCGTQVHIGYIHSVTFCIGC